MSQEKRFCRNLGWLTAAEQLALADKRVAIAGMGGVGGRHLEMLTRLGVGRFTISDLDTFEYANINRQTGAAESTIGLPKIEVMAALALDINPEVKINAEFDQGISVDNVEAFLDGADVYLDGLDFFVMPQRRAVFAACARMGIPAVTAAPLGMAVGLLTFMPGEMTFEEYFRLDGQPELEQYHRFLVGLAPAGLHAGYLRDPTTIDLEKQIGPSTPMGAVLCAGVACTQVLKLLLGRDDPKPLAAPWGLQFDAYSCRAVRTCWQPWKLQKPSEPLHVGVEAATIES